MGKFEKAKKLIESDIIKVSVPFINFKGVLDRGLIEVHKLVSDEVLEIFTEIKKSGFKIEKIKTIDNYNYSDEESVIDNNTSAFNFRFVSGSTKLSDHAIGLAIDINPKLNPWLHPSALNIFKYDTSVEGTITPDGDVVKIFKKFGWSWGGDWKNPDYQHFFKGGDLNKKIKNNLYDMSGIENPYLDKSKFVDKFKDFKRKL
jgi:hypothetical protein